MTYDRKFQIQVELYYLKQQLQLIQQSLARLEENTLKELNKDVAEIPQPLSDPNPKLPKTSRLPNDQQIIIPSPTDEWLQNKGVVCPVCLMEFRGVFGYVCNNENCPSRVYCS